jgi:two-component system NtrC family sensor kinase
MKAKKILLIDDEAVNLRVLSMSLRADGYQIITADSGVHGLARFEEERPDIVITDIKMPGMDGLEVLRRIKALSSEEEVIIITGHGDLDSAIKALHYGASDFINKPIREDVLKLALGRAEEKIHIRRQLKAYTDDLENMVGIATSEFERKSSFLTKLIRSSNDGIIATDDEWKIVIFNPGAERIFGYSRFEVVREMDARSLFSEDITQTIYDKSGKQRKTGELPWKETAIRSKTGENIPVRFSGTILWEKGRLMGSVAFFQDLREIKRLERELINSERLAAIGQTVAGMAHCIKNILHGFKGGSYLVDLGLDKNDISRLKNGWQMIQRNIGRTSDLVLDLLSYSKEREPEYQLCSPNAIAHDVCELLKEIADEHDVGIIEAFSNDIGDVVMDPSAVYRALLNLVSNAIDACLYDDIIDKKHCVSVTTIREKTARIRFEVEDNGSGMTDDVRAKLFKSFFSTKGPKGTGLGLLVTQKLIEENKGSIRVTSQVGKGTKFIISLPYHEPG